MSLAIIRYIFKSHTSLNIPELFESTDLKNSEIKKTERGLKGKEKEEDKRKSTQSCT